MLPRTHLAVLHQTRPSWEQQLPLGECFIDRPPGDGGFDTADYAIALADDWGLDGPQYLELRDAMADAVADVADEFWLRWGRAKIEAV